MKCHCCGQRIDEDPSLEKLAMNDICMAENGFQFDKGNLDIYFGKSHKDIPIHLRAKLAKIKKDQGI